MKFYFRDDTEGFHLNMSRIRKHLEILMVAVDEEDASLSVTFVHDPEIAALNRQHRGKDSATDVLSFSLDGEGESLPGIERMIGDIVISLDTALTQAQDYHAGLDAEVERLLIHGILHLLGHDHEEPAERALMRAEERRLAKAIDLPWPYLENDGHE